MQPGKVRSLKRGAWVLALALLPVSAFAGDGPRTRDADTVERPASATSMRRAGEADLIGSAQSDPFLSSASQSQVGLRSKPPSRRTVPALSAVQIPRPHVPGGSAPRHMAHELRCGFASLRTQNPRAPPLLATITS